MGGGKSAPEPPDYGPLAAVSQQQAQLQGMIALEQLDWQRQQWADQQALINEVLDMQLPLMEEQWYNAQLDRRRYEEMYWPLEEEYIQRAEQWGSEQAQRQEAAKAIADVNAQFEAQRQNALRQLESYGVDPSQTRHQALDIGVRTAQAAEAARAGTEAARQREREGMGMMGESINVGRGLPAQGLQYAGQALDAGRGAGNLSAAWQGASQQMGTPQQWMAGSDRSLGTWGNALTAGYNAALTGWGAEQNARNQMLGTVLGAGLGVAGLFAEGGEAAATDIQEPGTPLMQDGGTAALPPPDGGMVAGPGGPTDDAIPARLSDGEYVIPADVVRRKGTEFFDKLVNKVNEEQAQREEQAQVTQHALAIPPQAATASPAPGMYEGGEAVRMQLGGDTSARMYAGGRNTGGGGDIAGSQRTYRQETDPNKMSRLDAARWLTGSGQNDVVTNWMALGMQGWEPPGAGGIKAPSYRRRTTRERDPATGLFYAVRPEHERFLPTRPTPTGALSGGQPAAPPPVTYNANSFSPNAFYQSIGLTPAQALGSRPLPQYDNDYQMWLQLQVHNANQQAQAAGSPTWDINSIRNQQAQSAFTNQQMASKAYAEQPGTAPVMPSMYQYPGATIWETAAARGRAQPAVDAHQTWMNMGG